MILFQLVAPVGTVAFGTTANPDSGLTAPSTTESSNILTTALSYVSSPLDPPGPIDSSSATTTFTVAPGDFPSGAVVNDVTIDITFSKVGAGTCPGPGGGDDWAEEIRFRLSSPDGKMVPLVRFNDYHFSNPDVGQVTVTFDDNAAQPVIGLRVQDGAYQPSQGALTNFDGIDPAANGGVWTLELSDRWAGDPLCFASATLHIKTSIPPSLSVDVTDSPDPVMAGEDLFYNITVHNAGPDTAAGVVLTDTLPAEVAYVDDTGGCNLSAGTGPGGADQLICAVPNVAPGAVHSVQVQTHVPFDAVASDADGSLAIHNTAQVSSALGDFIPDDNTTVEATFVQDQADLRVVKLSQPSTTVQAGEEFTYTIFVDNMGPSSARSVVLTDTILSTGAFGLLSISPDPNRADSCTPSSTPGGTIIRCELGEPLEPQGYPPASGRWTIDMVLRANEAQDVSNLVDVASATPDPAPANNQAIDFVSVTAVADLDVDKPLIAPVTAGTTATYTVTVTNNGPSTAKNVTLVDELPVGMSLILPFDPGFDCSLSTPAVGNTRITCGLGNLPAGESRTLLYPVTIDAGVESNAILVNSASAGSDTFDDDNTNNYTMAPTLILSDAILTLNKSGSPGSIAAGEMVEYQIAIRNTGPSVAHNVVATDTVPAELTVLSSEVVRGANGTPPGSGGSCHITTTPPQVTCTLDQMPVGEQVVITVLARAATNAVPPEDPDGSIDIVNQAQVSASNGTRAAGSAPTTINRVSDLVVAAISEPAEVSAGGQAHYVISIDNDGPSDAANVELTATLPAEATYEIDTGGCTLVGTSPDTLSCPLGTLTRGENRQIDVFARILPEAMPGTVSGTFVVGSTPMTDPNATNDSASADILVLGQADLRITKFGRPGSVVQAGEHLTYTILVDNLGPGYAHDVVVDDLIQSDGTFDLVSVGSDPAATCTPSPGTYTGELALRCELNTPLEVMTPYESGRWQLLVVVRADEAQSISNVASVVSLDEDPEDANNHAVVYHEVTALSDLAVHSTAVGQTQVVGQPGGTFTPKTNRVTAGGHLSYTLVVRNHGPSRAENVSLQDRLPAWIEIMSVASSQGICNLGVPGDSAAPLICNMGGLSAQSSATITIAALVPSWVPSGTLLYNEALALGDTFDPNNINDFDTNSSLVDQWADLVLTKTQQPALALPGQMISYAVSVNNTGPSDAFGVVISDAIPAGIDDVTWECTAEGTLTAEGSGNLNATIHNLPAAGEALCTIAGTLLSPQPITNTATVMPTTETGDPYLENNIAQATNSPNVAYLPIAIHSGETVFAPDLVVEAIYVTATDVQIVIKNQGDAAVVDAFWVDVYIDPQPAPRAVNQTWSDLADAGCVWGVSSSALPLQPGETLTLSLGDAYYWEELSAISWPLPSGTPVYAQADSFNPGVDYGNVLEDHEMTNDPYNNVAGPILSP
jgi:uncharacterized repeat protein (TIGR01451 family)